MMIDFEDKEPSAPLSLGEIAFAVSIVLLMIAGYFADFQFWEWAPGAWHSLTALFQ